MLTRNELLSSYYFLFICLYCFHVSKWKSVSWVFFFYCCLIFSIVDPLNYVFFSWYRSTGTQPKKSISFIGPGKGAQRKGSVSATQSRMAMSKTMVVPADVKTSEKISISNIKGITQVIFLRILSLFENDTLKKLMKC